MAGGQPVPLGGRAFDVLRALIERRERLVTKEELLDLAWPGVVVEENNLQVQISTLRKLLGPQSIATIPGHGYRFTTAIDGESPLTANAISTQPSSAPSADNRTVPPTNLPVELLPLYGRSDDLVALRSLIEANRLVTVVGSGGIGKTALARSLVHQLRTSFDDGVWVLEFAPVSETSLVATTAAAVLRVALRPTDQVQTICHALQASRMLIIFDNCEHLLTGVAELATALLRSCPNVRLLATSQEPLKILDESIYRLDALGLPPNCPDFDSARQYGAIELFEARAKAADRRFDVTAQNLPSVVDICRHLDGIPLAIELAAARIPLLGVDGLRARLEERFAVLGGGQRLALPRHRTLRAALDWSHSLLATEEQIVFRRLGVFAGSFGLESAQRVASDEDVDRWTVLDHLAALVDKSLVVVERGEEPRYRLLETGRAFALEKLRQARETDTVMRRHAEAVLAVFEGSLEPLPLQVELRRYLPEIHNARIALEWAAGAAEEAELHIALSGAIAWIVYAYPRSEELRRIWSAIERIDPTTPSHLVARLLRHWPILAYPAAGDKEVDASTRAVEIYRDLGDRQQLFVALCFQSLTLASSGRVSGAEFAVQEAEQIFESSWPPLFQLHLLNARAWIRRRQARFEEAIQDSETLLELSRALNDKRLIVRSLIALQYNAAALGRLENSVAIARELIDLMDEDRSLRNENEYTVLIHLGTAFVQLGRINDALEASRSAYPLAEQASRTSDMLDLLAALAFARGEVRNAVRILGHADACLASNVRPRDVVEQGLRNKLWARLEDLLPSHELTRLMKEGTALSDQMCARMALN